MPRGVSFGCPCKISKPVRIIGLAPLTDDVVDFPSDPGEVFPVSGAGVAPLLFDGDAVFRPGVSDFFSSTLSAAFCVLPDLGRLSSDFFDVILTSYGLKASFDSPGEFLCVDLSDLSRPADGDDLVVSEELVFFGLSSEEMWGFVGGESAPI